MITTVYFQNAVSMLKQEYKEGETDLQTALQLAIKVLSKTLDMTKVTSEKGKMNRIMRNLLFANVKTKAQS